MGETKNRLLEYLELNPTAELFRILIMKLPTKRIARPFRFRSAYENEELKVKTCMKCHKNTGFFARGHLTRQNMPTIKFMLERGYMPPLGISMTDEEKLKLQNFLAGFKDATNFNVSITIWFGPSSEQGDFGYRNSSKLFLRSICCHSLYCSSPNIHALRVV